MHKLSQKKYLKFFVLQKTTTVDNYGTGGGGNGPQPPLFYKIGHFRKNNLD